YYGGAFGLTAALSFWEVGLSGWQLIPRLVGPFVILVLAILVAPALDQPLDGVHASGAWSALESLLPRSPFSSRSSISTRHRFNYRMHVQTLSSKIRRMRPTWVSGTPMAAVRARSDIRSSPKSRPPTSRTSSVSGPFTRATFQRSTDQS